MRLVVDSNILISALISPDGRIARLILRELQDSQLFAPRFAYKEIVSKMDKISKLTGLPIPDLTELVDITINTIEFVDEVLIPNEIWTAAYELAGSIDESDTPFVAMAIYLEAYLWTGDLKLARGLRKKGFEQVRETKELLEDR